MNRALIMESSESEQQSWTDGGGVEEQRRTFSPKVQREAWGKELSLVRVGVRSLFGTKEIRARLVRDFFPEQAQ